MTGNANPTTSVASRGADRVYWLHALTPLHIGAGQGEGYIDLPILREKVTNLPYVPGSSVKGVIADRHGATEGERKKQDEAGRKLKTAFGSGGEEHSNSGALVFTDARLVCLPVRSLYGTFAWCTSRFVLRRLTRDLDAAGIRDFPANIVEPEADATATVAACARPVLATDKMYLEDLDLNVEVKDQVTSFAQALARCLFLDGDAWQGEFQKRFAILPDDVFNFLAETGTEVQPHVKIEEGSKRAEAGALWYEESLPAESILAGLVWCDHKLLTTSRSGFDGETLLRDYCGDYTGGESLQIGGKATVGKGRVRCLFTKSTR